MQLVKLSANHYINTDLIIEVFPHLMEPGLTVVMAAPRADAGSDTEASLLKIYTIDLKGDEAENFSRWLEAIAEDGCRHVALSDTGD